MSIKKYMPGHSSFGGVQMNECSNGHYILYANHLEEIQKMNKLSCPKCECGWDAWKEKKPYDYQQTPKSLGKKQELFARLLPGLFQKAFELGFEIRIGDVFRDPRVHGILGEEMGYSSAYSCHKMKLAIDLNLMQDNKFLAFTEDYKELGEWWEAQHPLCRWGGKFDDGCHFSLTHLGVM